MLSILFVACVSAAKNVHTLDDYKKLEPAPKARLGPKNPELKQAPKASLDPAPEHAHPHQAGQNPPLEEIRQKRGDFLQKFQTRGNNLQQTQRDEQCGLGQTALDAAQTSSERQEEETEDERERGLGQTTPDAAPTTSGRQEEETQNEREKEDKEAEEENKKEEKKSTSSANNTNTMTLGIVLLLSMVLSTL